MNPKGVFKNIQAALIFLIAGFAPLFCSSQNVKTTDLILYGKRVQIASSSNILNGSVGALSLVQSNGSVSFGGNIYSDSAIILNNNNTVNGVLKANNSGVLSITSGTPISVGSNAHLNDSVVGNGNIKIGGGSVKQVFQPTGTTYSGPAPTLGRIVGNPLVLPTFPAMPSTIPIGSVGATNITNSTIIGPGNYGDVTLSGGQTITLSGTGLYVFKSIKNSGTFNTFVFDFKNITGNFFILVQGDIDLNKNFADILNGGGPGAIFTEALGTGSSSSGNAFNIANGSAGGRNSEWKGTVWVPNGNINIGTGSKYANITGALFTNNTINIQSNVTLDFAPFGDLGNGNPLIIPYFPPPPGGKVNNIIGAELTSLFENWDGTPTFEDSVYRVINGKVLIDIIVVPGQYNYLLNLLQGSNYGMTDFISNGNLRIITGFYPIVNLDKLNLLGLYINHCRNVFPPKKNNGVTTTNGDLAQKSDLVRNGYHVYGENVTVGILSDSYDNQGLAHADVANDDLPGTGNAENPTPVNVLQDYPFTVFSPGSDEGRAMGQSVHDIAPKANLAFRTAFISEGDFAVGVRQLADDANCDIIIDDVTYITEPFFRDGVVAQSADYVHAQNKVYISAAGNYGAQSYSANFNPVPAPGGLTGYAHNFGSGGSTDIYQNLSLTPGIYTVVLQWDNDFFSLAGANPTPNDLDFYLVDNSGTTLFGMNTNNFHKDPLEVLSFQVLGNTTTNIMVISANGSTNVAFKYIILRGGAQILEYNSGSSTIVGQANAAGALTVGAVRYTRTPYYGVMPPEIESFSSLGGTPVNGVLRDKPDFSAPDGGNTTVDLGSPLNLEVGESPVFPNFFGTSAAAPHAGGVAALLLSGSQKFRGTGMLPSEVKSLLQSTALDMATPGFDNISGAGFIQADLAIQTFASPTPILSSLTLPAGIDGETAATFTLTVHGEFFSPSSVVYLRNAPLATTVISSTEATAIVPGFTGNPSIRVYTPPTSVTLLDGGFSNSINLLDIPKKKVSVIADNKSKLYGESMPVFTAHILIDSIPIDSTSLSIDQIGLGAGRLQFTSTANTLSDVANYKITASMNPPLDTANAVDRALDELYTYSFPFGILSINKLPLTITPNDTTITYGDSVSGVTFHYQLGSLLIPDSNTHTIQNNLVLNHQSSVIHNTVALVDGKTISNGFSFSNLGFVASGKTISSGKTIVSGKTISNNFNVVPLSAEIFNNYIPTGSNLVNGKTISSGKSISNGKTIVSGKTISSSSTIFNSSVGDSASTDNTIVILDSGDVAAGTVSTFIPVNLITGLSVGESDIIPGAFFTAGPFSRNFDTHYDYGKLTVHPATLKIRAKDTSKVYGGPDPVLTYTVSGLRYLDDATVVSNVTLSTVTGANAKAGTYPIIASGATAPNYTIKYIPGTLTVTKAPLTVKVKDTTRVYGDPNPVFRFTYSGFVYSDNKSSIGSPPSVSTASQTANVGIYDMIPSGGSAANYYFATYLNGKLTITPASLVVKANDKVIFTNDKLGTFTSTYTSFKNSDNPTSTFSSGPFYSVFPTYSGDAGTYTVTPYGIVQKQVPNNYTITYSTGTLYVNPKGSGAKNVKPSLDCVDTVINNVNGFTYVAHFSYSNPNSVTIAVPLGSDNYITSSGSYGGQPPTVFAPGIGNFDIYFYGQRTRWTLTTYNGSQKTAIASEASSLSGRCHIQQIASSQSSGLRVSDAVMGNFKVYPNPVHDRATLFTGTSHVSLQDIVVVDMSGRVYSSVSLKKSSAGTVELNLASLRAGVYFIKVNSHDKPTLFKIVKL